jgi:hypothetical protein
MPSRASNTHYHPRVDTDPRRAVAVECDRCAKYVTADEVGSVESPEEIWTTLFVCRSCGQALLYNEGCYFGEGKPQFLLMRLWPKPPGLLSPAIPRDLLREFYQAQKCFQAGAYTATAVMVRRTLEGVCVDNGVTEKVLARALKKMHDSALIDEKLFDWAQALRVLGNEGAHFTGREVSKEDAADALALAEALLDYIYVLSAKFREFQTRRNEQQAL